MVSPERVEALQGGWVRLLAGFGVEPAAAYPAFDRLVAAHAEPHRHYHTLEHVAEVLKVAGRLDGSPSVLLAVWFHDAVYDPRSTENEEQSARFASAELEAIGLPADEIARVERLVRVTAHAGGGPTDEQAAILLDADLAILGASEARYQRYAADIRKEYGHVPDDAYRAGRAVVLHAFLDRPRIYHTPTLIAEGEAAARRNLAAELAALNAVGWSTRS